MMSSPWSGCALTHLRRWQPRSRQERWLVTAVGPPWPLCTRSLTESVQLLCLLGPLYQGVETVALQQTNKNPSLVSCNTYQKIVQVMGFSIFTRLYSHHPCLTPWCHHLQMSSVPSSSHSPSCPLPVPWQQLACSVSLCTFLLWLS